ncbi:MAG: hypothetical protein K6E49_09350 [Lachnospiraceae bacterium]|nr:hypothetical protein [Lachnospiraceae bacterium]
MSNLNSNITSLFNSLNTNSAGNSGSLGGIDLAGYAAVKNGSLGKLTKAYYAEGTGRTDSTAKSEITSKTAVKKAAAREEVDRSGLTTLKKEANELKSSAEALGKDDLWKGADGKADMNKVASAVKDFANNYNKVIDQASKVNSKEVAQDTKFMTGMTDTFSKVLGKIGISVGDDGKMTVDEEVLKKADVATAKSLFNGNATYGSQIADKANAISKDTEISTGLYGSDASVSSALSSVYNQFI